MPYLIPTFRIMSGKFAPIPFNKKISCFADFTSIMIISIFIFTFILLLFCSAYPMGLPDWDTVRLTIEGVDGLEGTGAGK